MASFSYVFCILSLVCCMNFQASKCLRNESDRLALMAIKDQIQGDPLGAMSSWNDSLHFCKWQGVVCSPRHQRVMSLDLSSLKLEGSVSPYIGNLSFLRRISFQENNLYGEIPREIGKLFRLRHLNLSFNYFQGEILTKLITNCSSLNVIALERNNFTGSIPVELDSLSKLNSVVLNKNNLTGIIAPSLGNLSLLSELSLVMNNVEGSIPNDLGRLSRLQIFQMSVNKLSGEVPSSLYNISSMQKFYVADNQLHGSLPSDMGVTLPNLQWTGLGDNQFTGPLPVTLLNASKLKMFDIRNNYFVGPVPVGGLQNLSWLNLGYNQLGTGATNDLSFITSLTNSSHLEILALDDNLFGGVIPASVANLSNHVSHLFMGRNQLIGSIPSGIENLVSLTQLGLEENFLTGPIPFGIGKLLKLQGIELSKNRLSGEIPSSICNITFLAELFLGKNSLHGSISSSLGNCQHLNVLDLSQNNLNGTIPKQVIGLSSLSRLLNLAQNFLTGSLPSEVGSLINLQELDISGNMLSGEIPNTIGNCEMLEFLRMNSNSFQGVIPSSLDALKGIQALDLSSNDLSGQVPKYLQVFTYLQYLNLSFNDLDGEIPKEGVFKNASAFSVRGNTKLCGGIPELKLPSCTWNVSNKHEGPPVVKVIVPTVTGFLCITILLAIVCCWKRNSKGKAPHISSMEDEHIKLSYADLRRATEGFSADNLIGVGSHGSVYKGILDADEKVVAVKVLNNENRGASKSFVAECETLRNARHRNLIKILTVCSSVDFKGNNFQAIVFEYMPNGNLEKWLHPKERAQNHLQNLSFSQRLNIAIEVASAMEYLHHHCQPPIAHCDLKPSNILLDNEMSAHVGDFGLAKLLHGPGASSQNQTSSFAIKGSIGYVPPEYGLGAEVSTQGDVYSYGILLLELFTGRSPTDNMFKDGLSLHEFARMALPNRVMEIVDPHLFFEAEDSESNVENGHDMKARVQKSLVSIVTVGVACSLESPGERMEMIDVAMKMQAIRDMLVGFGPI